MAGMNRRNSSNDLDAESRHERLEQILAALVEGEGHELLKESLAEARLEARRVLTSELARLLIDDATSEIGRALELRAAGSAPIDASLEPAESRPRVTARRPTAGDGSELVYVYGVGEASHTYEGRMAGVAPEHEVVSLIKNGLVAFVSSVPEEEFGETSLPENLNNIDWLRERAMAHQRVLSELGEGGPIVPMRFCTLYATNERVEELLEAHADILHRAIESVRGRSEWGVKVVCDLDSLLVHDDEAVSKDQVVQTGEGTRYLMDKKLQDDSQKRAEMLVSQVTAKLHKTLEGFSEASAALPPQSRELRNDYAYMPFNASYLVSDERREEFVEAVHDFNETHGGNGLSIETTGPWAPFTFVTIDLTEGRIDEPA
jgi:hypothetical protein